MVRKRDIKKKVSIIISVLDSAEALRRQYIHWENIGIPGDTEIIIVDDGSKVPIKYEGPLPVRVIRREPVLWPSGKRRWTASAARNTGVKASRGEYLLCFDLDHIITRDCLDTVRTFGGVRVSFRRHFGVLHEDGTLGTDLQSLYKFGFPEWRYKRRGTKLGSHPNQYGMRRDVFDKIGGYDEKLVLKLHYPQGEDGLFKKRWKQYERESGNKAHDYRPILYMFPAGYYCGHVDYDKFGIFHTSTRVSKKNKFVKYQETDEPRPEAPEAA